MKAVYFLFLLAALIFTDSTPVNALPACCISICVFQNSIPFFGFPNTFDGFLEFTADASSPSPLLRITGFLDLDNVVAPHNIRVAQCSTADSRTPGDPFTINLDNQPFDAPISTQTANTIIDIRNQCCMVVNAESEKVVGIAPVKPVVDCTRLQK